MLIRCTNAGAVLKRHSQASFRMLFQNTSSLGKPIATMCVSLSHSQYLAQGAKKQGRSRSERSGVFSESRASLLVKGFENAAQLGLPKHRPAWFLSVPIRDIRGSKSQPPFFQFSSQQINKNRPNKKCIRKGIPQLDDHTRDAEQPDRHPNIAE
jgi:hypothetical protein